MKIKEFIHRLYTKARFELWFLCLLVLIAVCVFLLISWIIGSIIVSIENTYYKVNPIDEKSVYQGVQRSIKDDYTFLLETQPSNLNGTKINQNLSRGQAIAVVIENYTPIRDLQKGLEEASIVYEAPAEGGITRLLAIYDNGPVDVIGPVRSARPYFITWASELRAGFVHVGGSQDALNSLQNNFRLFNIDEFSDSKTIWRDNGLIAPHNAYTSTSNVLNRLNESKYYYPVKTKRFQFKDPSDSPGDIRNITIDFSAIPYGVKYVYDPVLKLYSRYNGGVLYHNIKPSNVLVQFVDTEILDDDGRLRIQTKGTGKAYVFRDGEIIEGTWEKDSSINSDDQQMNESWTKFFDKNGDEIKLNKGQIWIEIVPNGRAVNYF